MSHLKLDEKYGRQERKEGEVETRKRGEVTTEDTSGKVRKSIQRGESPKGQKKCFSCNVGVGKYWRMKGDTGRGTE